MLKVASHSFFFKAFMIGSLIRATAAEIFHTSAACALRASHACHLSPTLAFASLKTLSSTSRRRRIGRYGGMATMEASGTDSGAPGKAEQQPERRKRVLSGVQPTGSLHLGNYLGAIRQWVKNQDEYESFFCVVDLHAITAPHDPKRLRQETIEAAALYLAAGIEPSKSTIFVQSHVLAHTELTWLLNCVTPMNWLERMIQFKEKAIKQGENVGVGLFDYPILMAADILLYQADLVPVGEDQRQHLELTRDIARRFNDQFCNKKAKRRKVFRDPAALIVTEGARVMSLLDGTSKMSKSAENDGSRINLLDSPDTIRAKIKRCKTDASLGLEWDNPARPECTNLLNIYLAVTEGAGATKESVLEEVAGMNWGAFKPLLTEAVVAHLEPIQRKYREVMEDPEHIEKILTR
ncbi:tryptophanyl-tRNA synthetase, partial [Nannochloropsis gaditana CCMP526]|uniref:tryptophanyl-tRNA synthetase n=1 Tax=Nannochloropsis gaditana (strain CCMP526) TaxID=1093141 RepID=UPI00029F71D3